MGACCRREAMVEGLMQSCDVYEDLLAKSNKGVEFYRKLELNVTRLLERTQRVCKMQEEERQQIMARLQPKGACLWRPDHRVPGRNTCIDMWGVKSKNTLKSSNATCICNNSIKTISVWIV